MLYSWSRRLGSCEWVSLSVHTRVFGPACKQGMLLCVFVRLLEMQGGHWCVPDCLSQVHEAYRFDTPHHLEATAAVLSEGAKTLVWFSAASMSRVVRLFCVCLQYLGGGCLTLDRCG